MYNLVEGGGATQVVIRHPGPSLMRFRMSRDLALSLEKLPRGHPGLAYVGAGSYVLFDRLELAGDAAGDILVLHSVDLLRPKPLDNFEQVCEELRSFLQPLLTTVANLFVVTPARESNLSVRSLEPIDARKLQLAHPLDPGAIVLNSWGWEQTQADFYQVVRRTKGFVWLARMSSRLKSGGGSSMSGHSVPLVSVDARSWTDDFLPFAEKKSYRELDMKTYKAWSVKMKYGSGLLWSGEPAYTSWYG